MATGKKGSDFQGWDAAMANGFREWHIFLLHRKRELLKLADPALAAAAGIPTAAVLEQEAASVGRGAEDWSVLFSAESSDGG